MGSRGGAGHEGLREQGGNEEKGMNVRGDPEMGPDWQWNWG